MRFRSVLFVLVLFATNAANADVVDISDLNGFQRSGFGGIFGNGIVFASPTYAVQPGSIVDFGTATIIADPPDGRAGSCPPNCWAWLAGVPIF